MAEAGRERDGTRELVAREAEEYSVGGSTAAGVGNTVEDLVSDLVIW